MMILPIETEGHTHDALIIILGPDNLERMKVADPAEVVLRKTGKRLVNPTVQVCYEEDQTALTRLLHGGDLGAILKHLTRGFEFRPAKGDHDRGPESLRESN